jgi:cell division protein FtsB
MCSSTLLVIGVFLFFPPKIPQTFEVVEKVEATEYKKITKYTNASIALENGDKYHFKPGGALRALDREKFNLIKKGDTVWILVEKDTNEVRALSVNGEVNFSFDEYLEQEYISEIIYGVMVSTVAICFFILSFYVTKKIKIQAIKEKRSHKDEYKTNKRLKLPNMNKKEMKTKYADAFSTVKKTLEGWDPLGIVEVEDEYEFETAQITPSVVRGAGAEELALYIKSVFCTMFGDAFKAEEECEAVAEKILKEYNSPYRKS